MTGDRVVSVAAAIVEDPGLDPSSRLAAALDRCGVGSAIVEAAATRGLEPAALPVVIVPQLGAFERASPAAADPHLVELLIDHLHDAGCRDVVVGASADSSLLWAGNRDVYALADLLGYRFVTPGGHDYDIVDLGDDLVPGGFQPGDVLAGTQLARPWRDAGYRIVFAKNRTDEADGYSLALDTVLRALPLTDDQYHYRLAAPVDAVVRELLSATPVQLAVIDAIVSCDGSGGARAPSAIPTDCIIAAHDIRLADAIGAIKMGMDPGTSRAFGRGFDGLDVPHDAIDGSLAVHRDFTPPHPLVLRSTRARDASPTLARLVRPWLQVVDRETFPLESPLDTRANERLAPLFADIDADPLAFGALVVANETLGAVARSVEAYRTLFDKDAVRRARVPLGFEPGDIPVEDYEAIVPELEGLQTLLSGAPERAPGLRWRKVGGATIFDYRRRVPIAFDEFVAVVDVARTISYMNDYLGGVVVPVEHDGDGGVVRQAERNLYLPQPNYVVLWGGLPIDVGKIEVVDRAPTTHRMAWKTVVSDNATAVSDDGIVTFTASPGGTEVTIVGRQEFVLPPVLRDLELGLVPDLEERLITHAYRTFFDRTLANLEALAEGRDIRIGRPWADPDDPSTTERLPAETLERLVEDGLDRVQSISEHVRTPTPRHGRSPTPLRVDADGFAHFRASPAGAPPAPSTSPLARAVAEFWSGLLEAGGRDLQRVWEVGR